MGAGSSGVDLNTIPQSAIDRMEVLRDGASAQYGSDAIAGVVNVVLKEGNFTPFLNATTGRYTPRNYPDDGTTVDVNGGWGTKLGRGTLALFGEVMDRQQTNRAWADPYDDGGSGVFDSVNSRGQVVIKRSPVPQPNYHWGDGLEKDALTMGNLRLPLTDAGTSELYAFGGYSFRRGNGEGYRRYTASERNWPEIYPLGYLPQFAPDLHDYDAAGGIRGVTNGWSVDLGGAFGHSDFVYNLKNTLNASLGPCLDPANPCAPGNDGILGNGDDPGIPNQTSFFAGRLTREEFTTGFNAAKSVALGLPAIILGGAGITFGIVLGRTTRRWMRRPTLAQLRPAAAAPSAEQQQQHHRHDRQQGRQACTDRQAQIAVGRHIRFDPFLVEDAPVDIVPNVELAAVYAHQPIQLQVVLALRSVVVGD